MARSNIAGLNLMRQRLGTSNQQDRMIRDKLKTLKDATKYSYQAAKVKRDGIDKIDPALINSIARNSFSDQLSSDDKAISVDFDFGYKIGDVFEWLNTKTKWIIFSQELTELAYFRGRIRRCNYTINWEDEDGNLHSAYAAVQGPLGDQIRSFQSHGMSLDVPNHLLTILLPKDENTLAYFKRYKKFYLEGSDICWRVNGVDSISTDGVIAIRAEEYYANTQEDDIEKGIVGSLVVKPTEIENEYITGLDNIKPKQEIEYTFRGAKPGVWSVEAGKPVEFQVIDDRHIKIKWTKTYSGDFVITNGNVNKVVNVESLF